MSDNAALLDVEVDEEMLCVVLDGVKEPCGEVSSVYIWVVSSF